MQHTIRIVVEFFGQKLDQKNTVLRGWRCINIGRIFFQMACPQKFPDAFFRENQRMIPAQVALIRIVNMLFKVSMRHRAGIGLLTFFSRKSWVRRAVMHGVI